MIKLGEHGGRTRSGGLHMQSESKEIKGAYSQSRIPRKEKEGNASNPTSHEVSEEKKRGGSNRSTQSRSDVQEAFNVTR